MSDRTVDPIPLVRPATGADILHIAAINEEARSTGYSDTGFIIMPLSAHTVSREIQSGEACYAVAQVADTIVGFVKYSMQAPEDYQEFEWTAPPLDLTGGVHIDKLVVCMGHRGHGIGTALYAFVTREHPEVPLYTYVLASPCRNSASSAFHERRGFEARGHAVYETGDGSCFREQLYVQSKRRRS